MPGFGRKKVGSGARDKSPDGELPVKRGQRGAPASAAGPVHATTDAKSLKGMIIDGFSSWFQPLNETGNNDKTSNLQADCEGETKHKFATYQHFALMLLVIVTSVSGVGLVSLDKTGNFLADFGGFAAKAQTATKIAAAQASGIPSGQWIEQNVFQKIGFCLVFVLAFVFLCVNICMDLLPKSCLSLLVVFCALYSMQLHEQPGSLKSWDGELKRLPSMTTLRTQRDNSSDVCLQFRRNIGIQDDALWTLDDMMWGEHSSRESTLANVREKARTDKRSFSTSCNSNADHQSIQVAEWKAQETIHTEYTHMAGHSLSCPSTHTAELQKRMQDKCTGLKALAKDANIPVHAKDDFEFLEDQASCNWNLYQVQVECHTKQESDVSKSTHYYIPHCKTAADDTQTVPCAQANKLHCAFKQCVDDLGDLGSSDRHWWSSFFERGDTHWQGMPSAAFPPKPRVPPPATGEDKSLGAIFVVACAVMYMCGFVLAFNHLKTDTHCDTCNPYMCVLFVVLVYAVREAVAS